MLFFYTKFSKVFSNIKKKRESYANLFHVIICSLNVSFLLLLLLGFIIALFYAAC